MTHHLSYLEERPGSESKTFKEARLSEFWGRWSWCFKGWSGYREKVARLVDKDPRFGAIFLRATSHIVSAVLMGPWVERKVRSKSEVQKWAARLTVDCLLPLVPFRDSEEIASLMEEELEHLKTNSTHIPGLFWRISRPGTKTDPLIVCHQHMAQIMAEGRAHADYAPRLVQPVRRSRFKCSVCGRSAPKLGEDPTTPPP